MSQKAGFVNQKSTQNVTQVQKQTSQINKVCIQSSQIALNQIIPGSQENYSLLYSYIKQVDKWIRPKKMSKDQTQKMIEEIYTTKFQKETQHLLSGKSSLKLQKNIIPFPQHVYETIKKKSKQQKQLEQQLVNLLVSVEFYSQKQPEIKLFQQFLQQNYDDDDLIFFLFARAISEKVVGVEFYQQITQKYLDPSLIFISINKAQSIAIMVYGEADKENLENVLHNLKKNSDFDPTDLLHKRERKISIYNILIILISLYSNKNLLADQNVNLQSNKNQNKDQNISKITERLESFITSPIYSNNKFNTFCSAEKQEFALENEAFINDVQSKEEYSNQNGLRRSKNPFSQEFNANDNTFNQINSQQLNQPQQQEFPSSFEIIKQSFSSQEKDILKNIGILDQKIYDKNHPQQEQENGYQGERNAFRASKFSVSSNQNKIRERSCEDEQEYQLRQNEEDFLHDQQENFDYNEIQQENQQNELSEQRFQKSNFQNKQQNQKDENHFMNGLIYKSEYQIQQERKKKEQELQKQKQAEQQAQEKEQQEYESYQIELNNENQQIMFLNVHQRLEEFIEVMIQDSSHLSESQQQQLKDKLYDIISRRVNDLLASIFNNNFSIWFRSCQIQEPTPYQSEYLQDLLNKYQKLYKISPEQISKIDLNQFSKKILQTPELAKEIGRLIVSINLN
ncbi:hypothetical protein TTHERM_00564160 (macronuclear) [Tetrahymena thermophila SB210]|uniref:Uncharacterized protein n=1 Tax=Tetrahymena thermophila (strain SB210) TaxID=312017 RepID=I7MGN9_TETTS|nr:hypothetical protein TTHERM_00564160 [Tetrahymena thermophila SB210]EAS01770.2 hypothetical protein TTHERM_00564160 [Tetrahymena thermophila SB210]|eukprot:XP_001022015.2 hypothetical protein TTHERM_00564160 [Tetrahymena thermophila SB210]